MVVCDGVWLLVWWGLCWPRDVVVGGWCVVGSVRLLFVCGLRWCLSSGVVVVALGLLVLLFGVVRGQWLSYCRVGGVLVVCWFIANVPVVTTSKN